MLAAQRGHDGCVVALLDASATPSAARADGLAPLHHAAIGGHVACAQLLLERRAQVDARDEAGWSALLYASHGGQVEVVRMLTKHGAPVDGARPNGFSPLMAACAAGAADVVRFLLASGADAGRVKQPGCYVRTAHEHALRCADGGACLAALAATGGITGGLEAERAGKSAHVACPEGTGDVECEVAVALESTAAAGAEGEGGVSSCGRVVFRRLAMLSADESWHERPVRADIAAARADEAALTTHTAAAGVDRANLAGGRGYPSRLRYFTNSTTPHGINIVHLVLRDHGFAKADAATEAAAGTASTAGAEAMGGSQVGGGWSLFWCGGPLDVRVVHGMQPWQRVSKFPGAKALTLKANCWRHYAHMREVHGAAHYDYMPRTFTLPAQLDDWRAHARATRAGSGLTGDAAHGGGVDSGGGWYIVKPNNASRSRGVFLTRGPEKVAVAGEADEDTIAGAYDEAAIAQVVGVVCEYLPPLLLDGVKFDLRLYVLVTSWRPLVVYLYEGGIARFATDPYVLSIANRGNTAIHLTNATCNPTARRMMLPELKERLARPTEHAQARSEPPRRVGAADVGRGCDCSVAAAALSDRRGVWTHGAGSVRRAQRRYGRTWMTLW